MPGWLDSEGLWGGDWPLTEEQLGISTARRRSSSVLLLAALTPCLTAFPAASMLGYPQGAPCPSWLLGALSLPSPRLKLLEHTRTKVVLSILWDLSCLVSQS